ncbi:P-loop containing nucleoside triphosphate hydrolases superfamily protein [Actinidia rufa]|uniref:P-loop containing nucleoside triphosphate hydrolases superfamily protein n=1 Tax=Actinidia rufa TaxID=165716 RepID=A0A7J0FS17_9ERIC|nr:P-loop containing nucleoside triphosphate hydrolases superfamily protein [Actinidia rufa]
MEQKHILMSALGVGIGVGVGLGLASGPSLSKWTGSTASNAITHERMEQEMLRLVVDGRDSNVTFDQFPYYLSEQTRILLISAAFVHLKKADFSKHTRNLSPASRAILLSGPAELYQQMLAKALAHYFEAKLLLVDVTDFLLKIQSKYGRANKEFLFKRSISETTLERMSGLFGSFSILQPKDENKGHLRRQSSGVDVGSRGTESSSNPPKLRRNASASADMNNLASQSTSGNPGPVLIVGSRIVDMGTEYKEVDERLTALFPYNIEIRAPEDENHLVSWKTQLDEDMKLIQYQDNRNHIIEVLAANDLDCDDLGSVCVTDTIVLSNYIEEIVVSAISYHLMNKKDPEYRNGKLVISSASSLSHGLSIFQEGKSTGKATLKLEAQDTQKDEATVVKPETKTGSTVPENKSEAEASTPTVKDGNNSAPASKALEVPPDNEFEKRIRPEVIPASEIGAAFDDIGALDDIKESLQELVMLPLRRPDLFKGGLLKPCRGILLFGPPGTGKTMLAKAIANEAGASFINVSMSTITAKWFGEDEKNIRALFTLAAKVSPTIIFVDEVDSMLGQRSRAGEHEAMRKIKNEFMTHWDGLLTKKGERILVLAATNRPFDLDEAIIRRFERRIMVGLPAVENREKIFRTLLAKEKIDEGLDIKELGTMTEGYSGSDLKNLCTTAAYRPVRELIQQERLKDLEKKWRAEEEENSKDNQDTVEDKEERVITIRPLNMEDFREARNQVAASFAAEGSIMNELKQWNDLYGEDCDVPELVIWDGPRLSKLITPQWQEG